MIKDYKCPGPSGVLASLMVAIMKDGLCLWVALFIEQIYFNIYTLSNKMWTISVDKPLKDYVVMSDSDDSNRWYDVNEWKLEKTYSGNIVVTYVQRKYFCICIYKF